MPFNRAGAVDSLSLSPVSADNTAGHQLLSTLHHQIFDGSGERLWRVKDFADLTSMPTTHAFIAQYQGQAAGLIVLSRIEDEAEVISIGLLSSFRGQGMASALLQAGLARFPAGAVNRVLLEVRENNHPAIRFYLARGFQLVGRRAGYYHLTTGGQQDALLFSCEVENMSFSAK